MWFLMLGSPEVHGWALARVDGRCEQRPKCGERAECLLAQHFSVMIRGAHIHRSSTRIDYRTLSNAIGIDPSNLRICLGGSNQEPTVIEERDARLQHEHRCAVALHVPLISATEHERRQSASRGELRTRIRAFSPRQCGAHIEAVRVHQTRQFRIVIGCGHDGQRALGNGRFRVLGRKCPVQMVVAASDRFQEASHGLHA